MTVTVADDDVEAPSVKLELPARLILEDAPRVVRWAIRDPSGLGQAEVDVAAPDGYGETIKRAVGEIDFGNRGPGGYSFFVKAIDDDRDRPGDAAGTPALHTFFVANDRDGDGVLSNADNCPNVANPDQADRDFDGFGDVCDPCPGRNGPQPDADGDGVGDPCDNCPDLRNTDQRNTDGDLRGDACDDDDDNDDVADAGEPALGTDPLKRDTDEGGVADGREVENRTDPAPTGRWHGRRRPDLLGPTATQTTMCASRTASIGTRPPPE